MIAEDDRDDKEIACEKACTLYLVVLLSLMTSPFEQAPCRIILLIVILSPSPSHVSLSLSRPLVLLNGCKGGIF